MTCCEGYCPDCNRPLSAPESTDCDHRTHEQHEIDRRIGREIREMLSRAKPERCTRCDGTGEEPSMFPDDRSDCMVCRGSGERTLIRITRRWLELFTAEFAAEIRQEE